MRAAIFITPATCAVSVRSIGASTDGGGDVRAASIVATCWRDPRTNSHSEFKFTYSTLASHPDTPRMAT